MKTSTLLAAIVACAISAPIVSAQDKSAPAKPAMSMDMDKQMPQMQENIKKMQQQVEDSARDLQSSVTQEFTSLESTLNQSLAQADAPALAPEAMEAAVPFEPPPPAEAPPAVPQMDLGFEVEQAAAKKSA